MIFYFFSSHLICAIMETRSARFLSNCGTSAETDPPKNFRKPAVFRFCELVLRIDRDSSHTFSSTWVPKGGEGEGGGGWGGGAAGGGGGGGDIF